MPETNSAFDIINIRLSQTKIILPEKIIWKLFTNKMQMAIEQCRYIGTQISLLKPYLGYNTSLTLQRRGTGTEKKDEMEEYIEQQRTRETQNPLAVTQNTCCNGPIWRAHSHSPSFPHRPSFFPCSQLTQ